MVNKGRYDMRRLPDGMTYDVVIQQLDAAYKTVEHFGKMTPGIRGALRYVARLIACEKLEEFHSHIAQRKP